MESVAHFTFIMNHIIRNPSALPTMHPSCFVLTLSIVYKNYTFHGFHLWGSRTTTPSKSLHFGQRYRYSEGILLLLLWRVKEIVEATQAIGIAQ